MALMMTIFWVIAVGVVVALVRRPAPRERGDADRVRAERLARGEIDEDEHRRCRDLLRSG